MHGGHKGREDVLWFVYVRFCLLMNWILLSFLIKSIKKNEIKNFLKNKIKAKYQKAIFSSHLRLKKHDVFLV